MSSDFAQRQRDEVILLQLVQSAPNPTVYDKAILGSLLMRYLGDPDMGLKVAVVIRAYGLTNSQLLSQCINIWRNGFRTDVAGSGSGWDTTDGGANA